MEYGNQTAWGQHVLPDYKAGYVDVEGSDTRAAGESCEDTSVAFKGKVRIRTHMFGWKKNTRVIFSSILKILITYNFIQNNT